MYVVRLAQCWQAETGMSLEAKVGQTMAGRPPAWPNTGQIDIGPM